MTLIKICGITNLDDALAAVAAGAESLGFNFYRGSSRYIEPQAARLIIDQLPSRVISVGVFVNEELTALESMVAVSGVSLLQLHGDESPEYCKRLKDNRHSLIKVFNTGEGFTLENVLRYDEHQWIMLDGGSGTVRGGTGQLSDWTQAQRARVLFPVMFLAGGLSPENVGAAIEEVQPFGVDACSSLEREPGKKAHDRMRDFVAAVRKVSPPCSHYQRHKGMRGLWERLKHTLIN